MNFFKVLFLLNIGFTFFLLVLLWLTPTHNEQAEAYGFIFAGWMFFFIVDLLLHDFPYSELIDTISVEDNEEKYPLQWFLPLKWVILFSIVFGVVWSAFYGYNIIVNKTVFISVPNLFSAVPLTQAISAQTFDIVQSSVTVGVIEENIWTGFMMPVFWAIGFILVYRLVPSQKPALLISLVLASLLTGYLVAYWFHPFVYKGNLYAYANAFGHFTTSSLTAGVTGNLIASYLAHASNNGFAKISGHYGKFTAYTLPLEAYIEGGGEPNRTFQ